MPPLNKKELQKLSDQEIIDLILSGRQPEYFEEIYDRYALKVYQKSLSFTKDDQEAKDLAHDILVKLYLNLSKFKGKSKFSTWVFSITYNYCVDHLAKKDKQLSLFQEINIQLGNLIYDDTGDEDILKIKIGTLLSLLETLTPTEKSILLMKYQDDFTIKEIAEVTNSGESAVKMKLKRTKDKLLKLYYERETR